MTRRKINGNAYAAADVAAETVLESYGHSQADGLPYRWLETLELDRQAAQRVLARDNNTAEFLGLYAGDVRLAARLVDVDGWSYWLVRADYRHCLPESEAEARRTGRVDRGLVTRDGLQERPERAPAHAVIAGRIVGPATCQAYIAIRRTDGESWGAECESEDGSSTVAGNPEARELETA